MIGHLRFNGRLFPGADVRIRFECPLPCAMVGHTPRDDHLPLRNLCRACVWWLENDQTQCGGDSCHRDGHGGALLLYATIIGFLVYRAKGFYRSDALKTILRKTIKSGVPTSLGIVSMVCFAMIMDHCQMITVLAEGISRVFGSVYPLVSPWIGLLGAFMTGSNTNSNVVFGVLQQETAQLKGLSTGLILAAQTTGGALGSMIAPAKILVGCSTVGLSGKEGTVLKATLKYGLIITGVVGMITMLFSFIR